MSAANDGGSAGRRLTGWFGRRARLLEEAAKPAAHDELSLLSTVAIIEAIVSGLPDPVIEGVGLQSMNARLDSVGGRLWIRRRARGLAMVASAPLAPREEKSAH